VTDQENYEGFWEKALAQLLHPTQLLIVEAISQIEEPISASVMVRISDGQIKLASYDYHCKRLVELGLLKPAGKAKRRGVYEKFYDFQVVEGEQA
jgi:hypothetical protein